MSSRIALLGVLCACVILVGGATVASADTNAQSLPFAQDWTNTGLITTNDDWSGVPGVVGYLGQDITTVTGTDPQTLLAESSVANDVDVIANQTSTAITNGGVAEFQITNPTVALQGSGTADAPYLLFSINTTGLSNVTVSYNLRDIDGTTDNAVQPVALQYRVGGTGSFTNVPAGYVSDATTGPSLATLVTPVSAGLPADASDKALVQVRVITTNAVGSDEWVGVDDISITGANDAPPAVQSTSPANGAPNVAVDSNIAVTFSEPVNVTGSWFSISCSTSGTHSAAVTGGATTFTLDPDSDFAAGETCTVTVVAAQVSDQDATDPPDTMAADFMFSFTTASAGPVPGSVVVSEVYGGGGNSGATLTNDFIELYNRTGAAINLTGWSVQYASAAGTSWAVTPLTGSIPSGRNYLVQEAAGAGGTQALPTPDATGSIAMSATAGKVALVFGTTALSGSCPTGTQIIDFVGYGTTASCFEGSGPAAAPSNTTSDQRNGGGATDTNNNAADFSTGAPDPHPSADPAPFVASTTPANNASGVPVGSNIDITFSEPVSVTGSWFTISCTSSGSHAATPTGGPTTFTLDPTSDFAGAETCSVTVVAADVSDQDGDDPPDNMAANYTFSFQTAATFSCADPATPIHDIQGSGAASPLAGSAATIRGIVVGDYQQAGGFSGYYVQEEDADADADPATSEGIFVFSSTPVSVGDVVSVRGTVAEFGGLTELNNVNATAVCSTGNPLPAATDITLPVASMSDFERYEGMLVHFSQTLTVTETFTLARFGEVSLAAGGRLYTPTAVTAPGASAAAQEDLNRRRSFVLDDGDNQQNIDPTIHPTGGLSAANTLRSGYTTDNLTGVFDDRFGDYRLQPVGPVPFTASNPRTAAPDAVGGNIRVASFNVLNFFNGNGTHQEGAAGGFPTARGANTLTEFNRQLAKEVSAITGLNADVVGLMELENDAPPNSAIEDLVNALNAATAPGTYAFIDTGVVGTDEIRVGMLYKPARVTPVGAYKILDSSVDPRFIDTKNRPVLAQTFELNSNGAKLTVVVNHLKSKGSDCNDVGDPDTGDGQGNCNLTRKHAVEAEVDWLATDPTGSGSPDYLIIGDMNSYTFEDPITTFTNAGYHNLVRDFHGLGAYSYVFDGESGYLDQAIASPSLAAKATGATDWHINADEPIGLDYNTEFKSANQINTFYAPDAYRASDHDPVVVGLTLLNNAPPTVSAGGPYTVSEGGSVTLSATGHDPDGDTLTYAWDLDNDGIFETPGQSVSFDASSIDGPDSQIVNVRVLDPSEEAGFDSATVTIQNADPSATFNAPATVNAGAPFTISLTSPSDPAPADTFTYRFDCGAGYGPYDGAASASCMAPSAGPITVRGTIRDDDGGLHEYTATVAVDRSPTADAGGPYTVAEGGSVTVSATGSDPDGDTLSYAWDLDNNGSFETSGQSVSFDASTIDGPASRTINVRATDPGGNSGVDSATVTIQNADPSATFNAPPTAVAGFPFTISLTSPSDPAPADTFTYKFDCGSGYGAYGAATSASCTATSAGPVTVRGTIRDDDGGTHEYTAVVNVTVTYDSLCDLTRLYVTKKKVEDDLCGELDRAEQAAAKGDLRKKQEHLQHYIDKVRRESGKSLTPEQAQILIGLARQL